MMILIKTFASTLLCIVSVLTVASLFASTTSTRSLLCRISGNDNNDESACQRKNADAFAPRPLNHDRSRSNMKNTMPDDDEDPFQYPINTTSSLSRPLPIPIQVMEDYIRLHSVDALRNDPHPENRNFAIALYQCPKSAGNNLHRFWNNVLWAILTNRTVLVKYWNRDVCNRYGLHECGNAKSSEAECGKILVRAPWMAAYDEWRDRISPTNATTGQFEEPYLVPYHATMGRVQDWWRFPVPDNYEDDYGVDDAAKYPQRVVLFPICYFKFKHLGNATLQGDLLKTSHAREMATKLYSLGAEFLYGMLHRYTFNYAKAVKSSIPDSIQADNARYFTIGLHSRHRFDGVDGCDIDREVSCLQHTMAHRADNTTPVQVRIMSDRPCTIANLTTWLQERNHSVLTAVHETVSFGPLQEHGPYAGIGFFRDLAFVSTVRSAIIGMRRSSSDLLRESVVFDRAMELWEQGASLTTDMRKVVHTCLSNPSVKFQPAATDIM